MQIADAAHPDYGTIGYITAITSQGDQYTFHVDIGGAKKSKPPVVRQLRSTQLKAEELT